MRKLKFNRLFVATLISVTIGSFGLMTVVVNAASTSSSSNQAKLVTVQNRAVSEIGQRLTTLNNLDVQVSQSTKLNSTDKSLLSTEIQGEIDGLSSLKTKLLADTTVPQANSDEASIFSVYRVYALMIPKVAVLSMADNQQNIEVKLTTLSQNLQIKISTAKTAGKNTTTVSSQLVTMNSSISSATNLSGTVRSNVLTLLPTDWNANHNLFSGDRNQLNQAYKDNTSANSTAASITTELKSLPKVK
ncbi:MAG TPA: hypothetical protein VMQ58_03140 [Candidatus Saccharimonadales bacterium]|jgi:hypothetical protein|nr:hypothetical protein [Candidatus Saccharimonadales bacterium]